MPRGPVHSGLSPRKATTLASVAFMLCFDATSCSMLRWSTGASGRSARTCANQRRCAFSNSEKFIAFATSGRAKHVSGWRTHCVVCRFANAAASCRFGVTPQLPDESARRHEAYSAVTFCRSSEMTRTERGGAAWSSSRSGRPICLSKSLKPHACAGQKSQNCAMKRGRSATAVKYVALRPRPISGGICAMLSTS